MKLYTKIAIIVTVIVLVVGGVWFWHPTKISESPSHQELKPAKTTHTKPQRGDIVKSKSKTQDETKELEKFSDEEIEEALEWLDSLSESEESLEPMAEEIAIEEQDDSKREEKDSSKLKEEQWKAEVEEIWERLRPNILKHGDLWREERRLLSIAKSEYGDVIPAEPYGNRIWELRRAMRKMHEEIMVDAGRYAYLTGQREAWTSEDGWLRQLLRENGLFITTGRPPGRGGRQW